MFEYTDTGDVKVSMFNLPAPPDCEQGKIRDKVIQVAGAKTNRKNVYLHLLQFSDEMKTT